MKTLIYAAIAAIASAAPAAAVDFRWTQGFGQGTTEAIIRNQAGSSVNIYCPAGSVDTTPGLSLETKLVQAPAKGRTLDIQIVVDGENHPFNLDERMTYSAAGRGFRVNLDGLVAALRKTKSKTFAVEYPQNGKSETFSTQNARTALTSGKTSILEGCE